MFTYSVYNTVFYVVGGNTNIVFKDKNHFQRYMQVHYFLPPRSMIMNLAPALNDRKGRVTGLPISFVEGKR